MREIRTLVQSLYPVYNFFQCSKFDKVYMHCLCKTGDDRGPSPFVAATQNLNLTDYISTLTFISVLLVKALRA